MATVKLQNGKVILKDGKVSCVCCGGGDVCCMYPADRLEIECDALGCGYSFNDLPNKILYQPTFSPEYPSFDFIELEKVETPYESEENLTLVYYTGSFIAQGNEIPGVTVPIEIGLLEAGLCPNQQICWAAQIFIENWNIQTSNSCLLIESSRIKDQFPDRLNGYIKFTSPWMETWYLFCDDGDGSEMVGQQFDFELTRIDLCHWEGNLQIPLPCRTLNIVVVVTFLNSLDSGSRYEPFKWSIFFEDNFSPYSLYYAWLGTKDELPDQKSPVGRYGRRPEGPGDESVLYPSEYVSDLVSTGGVECEIFESI